MRIKGINGERRFDDLAIQHIKHGLILNNLQFIVNQQYFQIDTLIIMNNEIYIFEIKNIHCDIFYKDNYFYFNNGAPIEKLNAQRTRTPKLFNQLLIQNHIDLPFNYYTTFVNPDYKVYGYSTQDKVLEFHMIPKMLQTYSQKVTTDYDEYIANQLLSLHRHDEKFNFRKHIHIEQLIKGVACHCHINLYRKVSNRKFICPTCKKEINCEQFIQKAIEDILLMYPMERLTVNLIREWTKSAVSGEKIRLYLKRHYTMYKCGPLTFYR
ncbi:nuclease-related domain-containing protein [Macrococcoides caseolyticum]|uniref:nuclease-related domain-containing protein n=1 Tax=Macrococcoides caseolyticum TaxID=69966 RepID=UPI001F2016BA|nr:nuclease-related domain-containing protein [Macrococcus caseolyticus]MCE4957447.1 NERD domain-containing protein [Macrococcus caseolyticus]